MAEFRARLNELIGPDHGWIGAQLALFALAATVPIIERILIGEIVDLPWQLHTAIGLAIIVASGVIVARAGADLAANVRMAPTPIENGTLVDHGIYGVVRHPMYLASMLAMAGWTVLVLAWSAVLLTSVALVFFTLKARHEEVKLEAAYPEYPEYRRRVRVRFIPHPW